MCEYVKVFSFLILDIENMSKEDIIQPWGKQELRFVFHYC